MFDKIKRLPSIRCLADYIQRHLRRAIAQQFAQAVTRRRFIINQQYF